LNPPFQNVILQTGRFVIERGALGLAILPAYANIKYFVSLYPGV
jgi:hypothetical protein